MLITFFLSAAHLVGSRHDTKRKVSDVWRETNCSINVSSPTSGSLHPMTITVSARRPRPSLNEHGHDYSRAGGPVNLASCTLSETEMHDLIRKRMECKFARDFDSADRIERDLRTAGVIINDGSREWTITGSCTAKETGLRTWSFSAVQCIDDAREKLQELLLGYMDFIGDSGAKGQLTYDVASSCTGPHCPKESASNAVGWRGPNGFSFLSLVELPFVLHDGIRSFHAHMILQTQKNQHLKRLGCFMYGDDFGVPLKYCDPYALVSGGSWQDVDEAVGIVREAIKTHMRICSCAYSL